jgi:hypothetical protein
LPVGGIAAPGVDEKSFEFRIRLTLALIRINFRAWRVGRDR